MAIWTATHAVPDGGMRWWHAADPAQPVGGRLTAGTALRRVDQIRAWARVTSEDGWTGWVDGRELVLHPAASSPGGGPQSRAAAPTSASPPVDGFVPTHVVPVNGMRAWASPDPTLPEVARLAPGLRLQVLGRRGDWAHVRRRDGWTGWVDDRRLVSEGAPVPETTVAQTPAVETLAGETPVAETRAAASVGPFRAYGFVGAVALAIGTVLPWFDGGVQSLNGFDVGTEWLEDAAALSEGAPLAYSVILCAVLVLAAAFFRGMKKWGRVLIGLYTAVTVFGIIGRAIQVVVDSGGNASDVFTDVFGIGILVLVVGAVLSLVDVFARR